MAHEVNNPAAFLLANLTVLQGQLATLGDLLERPGGPGAADQATARALLQDVRDIVGDNLTGVRRIATIVRALLDHAQPGTGRFSETRLDAVAEEACRLVERQIALRARLVRRLAPVPAVDADAGRLVQVVTNLLVNASHAVAEGAPEANEIEVVTAVVEGGVVLRVRDTGVGIAPDVRARLFEPFFTTRGQGKGTGLGLYLCAEIVRSHGGELQVSSSPGAGATFEVWFPTRPGPVASAAAVAAPASPPSAPAPRQKLKVLLVDDEPTLLAAYRRMLSGNHEVHVRLGGREAIELIDRDPDWDAILCDVLMPGVDGQALLEHVEARHPALARRTAFCTAGAFTPRSVAFADSMRGRIHQKPMEKEQLEAVLRALAAS